jgi:hypothetical protein
MKSSLYQISTEMDQLLEEVTAAEGELTPELEAKIAQVNQDLVEKTDGVVAWVNSQEDLIELAKKRISELGEFISRTNNKLQKIDSYVDACLKRAGTNKIEGKLYSISKRKPVQVVTIVDETLIPMDFIKIPEPKPAVQKTEIAKALKAGQEVPGAILEESKNISITYKLK